jgi:uncharacterized membrane protein YhaH (DUF805 family)
MFVACKRYFDFGGRSDRPEFWLFYLWLMLFGLSLWFGNYCAMRLLPSTALNLTFGAVYIAGLGASMIPFAAVACRRLHDTDRSVWWLLIIILPGLGMLALLHFFTLQGTAGANRFGLPVGTSAGAIRISD